jgi:hypothetical protein
MRLPELKGPPAVPFSFRKSFKEHDYTGGTKEFSLEISSL